VAASVSPSSSPSETPSSSSVPSSSPSLLPSSSQTPSEVPTISAAPSISALPSSFPTVSLVPSSLPSASLLPSDSPTASLMPTVATKTTTKETSETKTLVASEARVIAGKQRYALKGQYRTVRVALLDQFGKRMKKQFADQWVLPTKIKLVTTNVDTATVLELPSSENGGTFSIRFRAGRQPGLSQIRAYFYEQQAAPVLVTKLRVYAKMINYCRRLVVDECGCSVSSRSNERRNDNDSAGNDQANKINKGENGRGNVGNHQGLRAQGPRARDRKRVSGNTGGNGRRYLAVQNDPSIRSDPFAASEVTSSSINCVNKVLQQQQEGKAAPSSSTFCRPPRGIRAGAYFVRKLAAYYENRCNADNDELQHREQQELY